MHDKHVSHSYRKYTLESKEITVLDSKSMLTLFFLYERASRNPYD